jgi:hypothetical protein
MRSRNRILFVSQVGKCVVGRSEVPTQRDRPSQSHHTVTQNRHSVTRNRHTEALFRLTEAENRLTVRRNPPHCDAKAPH